MRHKYETRGIVLSRASLGEASMLVTIITADLGLVQARAQGLRQAGAKLASALTTFAESDIVLVRGKEGWRVSGAVLAENWYWRLSNSEARQRGARVSNLLLRLGARESRDKSMFQVVRGFLEALSTLHKDEHEDAEVLAAIRTLAILGLDSGSIPSDENVFSRQQLSFVAENRIRYISRINNGISASGL